MNLPVKKKKKFQSTHSLRSATIYRVLQVH
nr:MAG TPA: hypothetical protein [Caudoviricetes sp.]